MRTLNTIVLALASLLLAVAATAQPASPFPQTTRPEIERPQVVGPQIRPELAPPRFVRPELLRPELLDRLRLTGRELYFADCAESNGAVYRVTLGKSVLFRRSSGRLSAFEFAPWDPDRLYFVNGSDTRIFQVDLDAATPTESVVFTHSTFVRHLAFDASGALYFSEASGAGGDGRIWRVDPTGGATVFFTVALAQVDGFWAGRFDFAPDGTLLVSSGNRVPSQLYEADLATGTLTSLFTAPSHSLTGFSFNPSGALFITDQRTTIRTLDLAAGTTANAYQDAAQQWICDVGFRAMTPPDVSASGTWVLPYGLRGFRVDQIKANGLVDYGSVVDAPFGGHLGFLLNSANVVPTPAVHYYRLQYRRAGSAAWIDFDAPVFVHYVRNRPGTTPVFPLFQLGPQNIGGRNLYRFRPHESDLPALTSLPPGIPEWPKVGFPGDIYRGHLNTVALGLAPGQYEIRYEIYNSAGVQSIPGAAFQMIVPTGTDASGTLLTAPAPLTAGGFEFTVHVDNRVTEAAIEPPAIGATVTDACGFLRYTPAAPGDVRIGWRAWHPGGFATYSFNIVKGAAGIGSLPLPPAPGDPTPSVPLPIQDEVFSAMHNGSAGNFFELSPTLRLLDGCREAAFAADLHVRAKAVNGDGDRLRQYDSRALRAFAIAPR